MQSGSKKSSGGLEVISTEDIEGPFIDGIASPPLEYPRNMNQDQVIEADTSDRVDAQGHIFQVFTPLTNRSFENVSPGHKKDDFERIPQNIKQSGSDQHFWPMKGQSRQQILRNDFPASTSRVKRQDATPDAKLVREDFSQSGRIPSRFFAEKREHLHVLNDHAIPGDNGLHSGACTQTDILGGLVQEQKPKSKNYSERDHMWVMKVSKTTNQKSDHDLSQAQDAANGDRAVHTTNPVPNRQVASHSFLADSTACSVQNYIHLKKGINLNSQRTVSEHFPIKRPPLQGDLDEKGKVEDLGHTKTTESRPTLPPMAKPQYIVPKARCYVIISTYFPTNPKLTRKIQRLYPGAELIARGLITDENSRPGFQTCLGSTSNLVARDFDEADITISPGTGIILTTLQKIAQCSLPGQAEVFLIRERVARVAPRYERLLIFVSADEVGGDTVTKSGNAEPHVVDNHYKAVVDFMGFCATLQQNTRALFIAGNEDQIAEWIVATMVKYGEASRGIKLAVEETKWEIFLRRAGFNSFAAQAILGELKGQSTAEDGVTARDVGLAAFVKMSEEQRVKRFEKIFGGNNLLKRVSFHLDAQW